MPEAFHVLVCLFSTPELSTSSLQLNMSKPNCIDIIARNDFIYFVLYIRQSRNDRSGKTNFHRISVKLSTELFKCML